MTAIRYAGFAAVSTKPQAKDKASLPDQMDRIRQTAQRHGWQEVAMLEVKGRSRSIPNLEEARRQIPEMEQLVRLASRREIDLVVCLTASRLARDLGLGMQLRETLAACHVQTYCLDAPIEPQDPAHYDPSQDMPSELVSVIGNVMARHEKFDIVAKARKGKLHRARSGDFIASVPPYGYTREPGAALVAVPAEHAVIRRAAQLYLEGFGDVRIARQFNADAVPTRKGGPWIPRMIGHLLTNPIYAGTIRWGRTVCTETVDPETGERRKTRRPGDPLLQSGHHGPVFSEQEWLLLQGERARRRMVRGRAASTTGRCYLLSGLIRCGHCGEPMIIVHTRESFAYQCSGRRIGVCKVQNRIGMVKADAAVLDYLEHLASDPQAIADAWRDEDRGQVAAQLASVRAALEDIPRRRQRWATGFERGDIESGEYRARREALDAESVALHAELAHLQTRRLVRPDPADRQALLSELLIQVHTASRPRLKMYVRQLIARVIVTDRQVSAISVRL